MPEPFFRKNIRFRHKQDSFFEEHFCAIPYQFKLKTRFATGTNYVILPPALRRRN
jgi:hypothetical protein